MKFKAKIMKKKLFILLLSGLLCQNIYADNNELISTTIKTDTCNMVHCDLGWGGNYNGYYVSGIFNLNNNDNEYDGNHSGEKRKYNTYVKLLTYNRK